MKQAELGVPVAEVIRKAGISEQTFYGWMAQYAGLEVDQVRQMAQLLEENLRLNKLVAELVLDKTMLQDVISKMVKPSRREPMVDRLMSSHGASERRACRVPCVNRGTYRYRSCLDPRTELRMRIREIAQGRLRYGYRKIRVLLNRGGWDVGKYLAYQLCKEEGLMLKRMKPDGRRKVARQREEKLKPTAADQAWSMDFVLDQLQNGARFRSLAIVDVYTREVVVIEVGQSLKGDEVVRTLNRLKLERGVPKVLFCDNGSEFTSHAMDLWAYRNGVKIDFSRPGKPTDNAFVESFNGTFRSECLNTHWFLDLKEARQLIEAWRLNIMRVVLTHRSPTGHQASSPASTRLAAYWLEPKQVED